MEFTENEAASLDRIADRLAQLHAFLDTHQPPRPEAPPQTWFSYLAEVKAILGNFSNDLSLVSCLMAKDYLTYHHEMAPFDVAEKPQGASGLDVDECTTAGERIIGEIKTTTPYHKTKFGANQIATLRKDFAKLAANAAPHKYMFVTDVAAFEALKRSFATELQGVTVVCLSTGDEFGRPVSAR